MKSKRKMGRVFYYTRPKYGSMWFSIYYKRSWNESIFLKKSRRPFTVAEMKQSKKQIAKAIRKKVSPKSALDKLRVKMSFKTYNQRSRQWKM